MTGWKNAFLNLFNKLDAREKALYDSRLAICRTNECGMLTLSVCSACGCPVSKKTKSPTEQCPENMWRPYIYDINGRIVVDYFEIPEQTRTLFIEYLKVIKFRSEGVFYDIEIWEGFLEWLQNEK